MAGHGGKFNLSIPQPGDLSHWSHQICRTAWKYHKIAGQEENFKLLKPPNISKYVAMIAGHGATGENFTYWSHQICSSVAMLENERERNTW